MTSTTRGVIATLGTLIAILVLLASGAGVFLRGDLVTETFTTVRGDQVEVLVGGVYRFNGENIGAEGIGWDLVTLFLVLPAFVVAVARTIRGSMRATLATLGLLTYFAYQYAEYAMALAYGPLFLVYAGIFGLSLSALAATAMVIQPAVFRASIGPGFPHRGVIAFGGYMATLLALLWLPLIVRTFTADQVTELYGGTTLVVQAFDLGLLVPLGLFTAATVHRRLLVGYVLSAMVVVKGMAMGTAIAAMLVVEYLATGELAAVPLAIFMLTALGSTALAARVFGSIDGRRMSGVPSSRRLAVARGG